MKSRTHQLGREYAPSGDFLFNLFGMPETASGAENEPFFGGSADYQNVKSKKRS